MIPDRRWLFSVVISCFLLAGAIIPAVAQTESVDQQQQSSSPTSQAADSLVAGNAQSTEPTSRYYTDARAQTTLVQQAAEQNSDEAIGQVESLLRGETGVYNDTYFALHQWFSDDWVSNLFANMWQLVGKWLIEFIQNWVSDTVQFLTAFVKIFVLNPNIPVNGLQQQNGSGDDISKSIKQATDIVYGIAVDISLILFVFCIWRFWADAAWKGGGNLMGSVGRLIFAAGLLLAWPTIFAFEIQISNEMIKALYFNSATEVTHLDAAMAAAVQAGLVATSAGLAQAFAPIIGTVAGGALGGEVGGLVLGTVGDVVSFAGLILYSVLGVLLIAELIYLMILKAIQTLLLTAQYLFGPIFLVCFASPDTESYASGYVKAWIETSLWTFIWVGLFKLLVIFVYSDFNPWGKILMVVGVLQLMIQVPSFMARAMISPMSDFISAGLLSGMTLKGLGMLAGEGAKAMNRFTMQKTEIPAMNMEQSKATALRGLARQAANPETLAQYRAASQGLPLNGHSQHLGMAGSNPPKKEQFAQALASPGLNVAGTPESEEEKRKRLQERAAAQQYAALLSAARQGAPGAPGGTPFNAAVSGPGGMNATALGALTGVSAGIGRSLSPAAVQRGMMDPTLSGIPDAMQTGAFSAGAAPGLPGIPGWGAAGVRKSGVINPAEAFNHAGYKFVEAKIAAVNARTYGGTQIGYSDDKDGANKLVGDGRGNLLAMRARKGATPEEVAHLVMAGGYTELFKSDSEAYDAARASALSAGAEDPTKPKGLSERIAAGWIGYNGGTFRGSSLAKQRFNKSLFEQAALGSEAYISGKSGNAYTQYLQRRFGDWTADDDTWAVHIMTDSSIAASPWNPAYSPATDALVSGGMKIDEPNRGAAGNQHVMKMQPWMRKAAIPAVRTYAMQIAESMYPGAPESVLSAAVLGITAQMGHPEVEAATAMYIADSGSHNISIPLVQAVAELSSQSGSASAGDSYKSLKSAMQSVAAVNRRQTARVELQVAQNAPASHVTLPQLAGMVDNIDVQGPTELQIDVQATGAAGSVAGSQYMSMNVPSGSGAAPDIKASSTHRHPNVIETAKHVVMQLYSEQFTDKQIQDQQILNVAHYFADNHPHMMHSVSVAVDTLLPQDLNVSSVSAVDQMLSSGYNRGQISRAEVEIAQRCIAQGRAPSPRNISDWRQQAAGNPYMNPGPPRN
jgi:hypothetical protein